MNDNSSTIERLAIFKAFIFLSFIFAVKTQLIVQLFFIIFCSMEGGELFQRIQDNQDGAFTERGEITKSCYRIRHRVKFQAMKSLFFVSVFKRNIWGLKTASSIRITIWFSFENIDMFVHAENFLNIGSGNLKFPRSTNVRITYVHSAKHSRMTVLDDKS